MRPWWDGGLPFACTQCGKCCHARGGYDKVHLNAQESRRLARHLGLSLRDFHTRFTERDPDGYRVLRFVAGRCTFLEGTACTVHEAKPTQCRTWPFWPELLTSRAVYAREVQAFCPGSRGGDFVPASEIRRQLQELAAADAST